MPQQDPKTWWKDFSGLRLTKQTQDHLVKTDSYDRSKALLNLNKIQDQVIQKAKQSGDRDKIKEADAFAVRLHKEENFLKYSK